MTFKDSDGKPVPAADSAHDATAQAAEEKLRRQAALLEETQRRLDRASMSTLQGHWEIDLATGRHWASRSYLALLGLPQDSQEYGTRQDADRVSVAAQPAS
jgi:hypothetical protein